MTKYLQLLLLGAACAANTACVGPKSTAPYVVQEEGRSTWRVLFDKKMPDSAGQWDYARETQNKGQLKKADRRMLYLVRRWPNSKEAPWAQRARADMLYARGDLKEAFKQYQYLIDNYSGRMLDYDAVLESQFNIAVDIMNHRRMRWIFGGYRAPEYAVEYFEDVIRNGPQWPRAQEAQYLIGKCYQEAEELELAVSAYGTLGYRYPDSSFAQEAAWQQIQCLDLLRKEYPNSLENLDRTLTATTVFLTTFPKSEHRDAIILLRNQLYEVKAQKAFDEAAFYAKVPKKPTAAIIYYEGMIAEYPKSKLVPLAQKRITELKRLMALTAGMPAPAEPATQSSIPAEEPDNGRE
ncbi:MAG: tetratricopeptide repeat protein [Kiritimatiellales bacterium]|nr:tetratricopeptide repeat protein [Kiritimatiellales bacterium]